MSANPRFEVPDARNTNLYIVNTSLLLAHQVDSAYWHEWRLFGIPGGIQAFVAINLVLIAAALIGLREITRGARLGSVMAVVVACCGIFAFGIHSAFLLKGHAEFRLPVSLALLLATLVVSIWQLATLAAVRGGRASRRDPGADRAR
jgi:hypothetical protein